MGMLPGVMTPFPPAKVAWSAALPPTVMGVAGPVKLAMVGGVPTLTTTGSEAELGVVAGVLSNSVEARGGVPTVMAGIGTSKVPPEVMVSPGTVTPEGSFSTAEVTEAPNVGAVKVKFVPGAEFDCWTAVGVTENVPVNDAGATTLRLGSGGWPAVPVCATTPECPTTRRL